MLLESKNGYLPLHADSKVNIAVVGPNANSVVALEGNYNGHADEYVTVAEGIRRVFGNAAVTVADGSRIHEQPNQYWEGFNNLISEGLAAAGEADITVLVLGLDRNIEGEDLGFANDYTDSGDRKSLSLPACQIALAERVCETCENVIVVVMCGSCVDLGEKVRSHAKAVLHAWYPGALGGLAVARVLAGESCPGGRLPITFYRADAALPPMEDYSMENRTYRFYKEKPLYPFGYGLGYTQFSYGAPEVISCSEDKIVCRVSVTNVGARDGREKAQCYARFTDSRVSTPRLQLCAVQPVFVKRGETETVTFEIDRFWLMAVLPDGTRVTPDGDITLYAGGGQPEENARGITL